MSTTLTTTAAADALADRLFEATIGTLELYAIHLGRRLGLYEVLADGAFRTPSQLATDANLAERYAREWLEQQAVAGFLEVEEEAGGERRYRLGAAHARVLAQAEDPVHLAPFASMLAGIGRALPRTVEAYRTGEGVPYREYGDEFRDGQAGINRPAFTHDLVTEWLPAVPEVHQRLLDGARVADIGCGLGWSTQAIARAYDASRVVGIDADAASVRDAEQLLPETLAPRVRFVTSDARHAADVGVFDLVVLLESLHDFGNPTESLIGIRQSLAEDGIALVADERVAEHFTAPGDQVERMMFGWSVVHCLPAAIADGDHGAIGTALRPAMVRSLATDAGFASCEVLPIDNELFRFYRLAA